MVLLLVLIHPLVSQTDGIVCIRAFFRVEGKAAAGADRQKTACDIIGCCNSLTDKLDLAAGLLRGYCANGQQGKFIAAQRIILIADAALQALCHLLQQLVAHLVAIGIVDRLETIQIRIAALGRVQLLSPALVVFIVVIFQITHHKPALFYP